MWELGRKKGNNMKEKSLTRIIKEKYFGKLRAFITLCDCGGNGKLYYVGHIYGSGDDDTSHWKIKRRTIPALLKAMEKRMSLINKPYPK